MRTIYNLKNEFQKVKKRSQVINNSLIGLKSLLNEITEQVMKTNDENSNMEKMKQIIKLMKYIIKFHKKQKKKKNSKKNYEKLESVYTSGNNINSKDNKGELSESDLCCLEELTKYIIDLEKQI